jgi:RNA polymerase sigma-70 factor (ECF subfamily)
VNEFISASHPVATGRKNDVASESQHFEEMTDAELALAVGQRSEGALAEAYRRCGVAVYHVAFRLCGPKTAEDVTHKVFLDLWDMPDAFDPNRESLHSYLVAAAHRRAVYLLRNNTPDMVDPATAATQHYDRGSKALALSANHRLRTHLVELSEFQRQAILLAYFGGYTYRQIAERLRQSEPTVKDNVREGLTKLRLNAPLKNRPPAE